MSERVSFPLVRGSVALVAAMATSLLLGGAASAASPTDSPASDGACTVVAGDLSWGFKESFRAYISGSIAHGEWTTSDGATYDTPAFGWSGASGTFDPRDTAGDVAFGGGIRFTGHDGLLDTTVSNPVLRFPGDGTAQLLVDLTSVSMEDALSGAATAGETFPRLPLVALDLAASPLQIRSDTVTGSAVGTAITPEGFEAFGSYEPGTAFDPVTFSLTLDCPASSPAPNSASPAPSEPGGDADAAASAASPTPIDVGWLPWALAGGALAAAAVVLVRQVGRRRRRRGPDHRA